MWVVLYGDVKKACLTCLANCSHEAAFSHTYAVRGYHAGNTNTLAGNVPPKADLGDLRGLAAGLDGRHASMINGGDFDGAKAYKDSKVS